MNKTTRKPKTAKAAERPLLGGLEAKLTSEQRPGFTRRIVNDDPGRIANHQRAGYTLVEDENLSGDMGSASNKTYHVGTHKDGSPRTGYLMEKPKKHYDEDQARKMAIVKEREAQIFRDKEPEFDGETSASDKRRFYVKEASHG